jgi:hypothetical protein
MRRAVVFYLSLLLSSASTLAAVRAVYRIDLADGTRMFSQDRPVQRGSVMLFHSYPNGVLTSVPEEDVVGIRTTAEEANRVLQPGDVVFLGPTGGGQTEEPASGAAAYVAPSYSGGVYDPRNPSPYYGGYGPPRNPNGTPMTTPGNVSDLGRALAGEPPTLGSNGYPAAPGLVTVIGPDGAPVLAPAGTPGAVPLTIGPDGNPIIAPPGSPGSTPPAIGPNGTPVMAPQGAPGSGQPVIGPNGTPVLVPPGAPGSVPPAIGPNGTPSGPNASPPIGPNGFPAPPPQPHH